MENEVITIPNNVRFAALNPYLEDNIVKPVEKRTPGDEGRILWGEKDLYPEYLVSLYENVPTLQSIIEGTVDFIAGDYVKVNIPQLLNMSDGDLAEQIRDLAGDVLLFGGFALQVVRGRDGSVAEVYYIDIRKLRTNKDNTVFWYCDDWGARFGQKEVIVYPAFMEELDWAALTEEERNRHASSILYVKMSNKKAYPVPRYAAAVKAAEIEKGIDNFHLNSLDNGFSASYIVNFNNGVPTDNIKEEIEENFTEKFSGHQNAGRVLMSWNNNKDCATTIEKVPVDDFGDRYKALSERSRQQLFTAFRANPNLFGIPTEGNGFANEQYEESYKLYNRTVVRPLQKRLCDAYDKIFGVEGLISIKPFSLAGNIETEVQNG